MRPGGVHASKDKCCTNLALVSVGRHGMVRRNDHKYIGNDPWNIGERARKLAEVQRLNNADILIKHLFKHGHGSDYPWLPAG